MKRTLLLLVAALSLGATASAQYYHYSYAPWTGNKAYSLNVGTTLDMKDSTLGFSTKHIPLAASIRFDGEKDVTESFSWGYQAEVSYLRHGYDFTRPYDGYGTVNQTLVGSRDDWNLQVDLRLLFAYYFTDNFELSFGAGVYYDLIKGRNVSQYRIDRLTGVEIPDSHENDNGIDLFSSNIGVSLYLGANYYLSEEFFLSLSLRDQIGVDFFKSFDEDSAAPENRACVMVGVGYKIIR